MNGIINHSLWEILKLTPAFLNLNILKDLFNFLRITTEQAFTILIFPIIFDGARSIIKSLFLLLHEAYIRIKSEATIPIYPLVTIIVPAHNEEKAIEMSILSLLEQKYQRKEIIVVDDGSTDRTYQIANSFAEKGLIKLVHREKSSGKKAIAVNHGLAFAQGEILVTVDADTVLEPMALQRMIECFSDINVGAVAGNVRVLNHKSLLTRLQAYEYLTAMEMGRRFQAIFRMLMIIPGAAGAIRLELAKSIGMYDPDTITEDFDITIKVHKTRSKVKYVSNAIAWTVVPESWGDWVKQRNRWAAGQLQTLRKHHNLFFEYHFGRIGIIAAPDMVLMDIILLVARTAWLILVPIIYFHSLLQLFILTFFLYFFIELIHVTTAALLSPRKHDITYLLLAPVVIIFYRPFYGFVRLKAYLNEIFGGFSRW